MMGYHVTRLPAEAVPPPPAAVEPDRVFTHPDAVLAAPYLTREDKRAYLAGWASDVWAVESAPALRYCPGQPDRQVPLDDVLAALRALDGKEARSEPVQTRDREPTPRPGSRASTVRWLTPYPRRRGRICWLTPVRT
jgi:hypothetical protein